MTNSLQEPTNDEIAKMADEFEESEFSESELATVESTRRCTPRIGELVTE